MRDQMRALTESTLVPLSLVVVIIGGVWIAGHVSFQTEANTKAIDEIKINVKAVETKQDAIAQIQTDIAVIKSKVETIEKRIKE